MNAAWIVALVAGCYALAVAGMWLAQRKFIYHPAPVAIDEGRLRQAGYAPFAVRTQDGLDLTAWRRAEYGQDEVSKHINT